jgi:hypothetical protein
MTESTERYIDHPAPSIGLVLLFFGIIGFLIAAIPLAIADIPKQELCSSVAISVYAILGFSIAFLSFYFWPLYTTYYIVDKTGITVKYGPWTHVSQWDDFKTVYRQKGMFVTKIGWPSINVTRQNASWGKGRRVCL